ncbi:MAG: peptidylprolyl isomerase [Balneolaceae bacterium]
MDLNSYKKVILRLFFFFSLSLVLMFPSCQKETGSDENILAKINDLEVTEAHFISAFKKYYYKTGQSLSPSYANKSSILDSEFNTYVLAVHAGELGISETSEAMNMKEMIKRRVLNEEYLEKEILTNLTVSNEEVEQMFVKFNTQLNASHIYAPTAEKADSLYKEIKNGKAFEAIAKREFKNTQLAENGGNLGIFSVDEMDVAFERKAYEMKTGEISKPVRTAQGFSIIKLNDRYTKPVLTEYEFASNKNQFASFVEKQKKEIITRNHLDDFINAVSINKKLVEKLWSLITNNYSSFISKDSEFLEAMNIGNDVVASSGTFSLELDVFLRELKYTPIENLNNVKNLRTFENLIHGLSYRSYLYEKANSVGLHEVDEVISSINQSYHVFLAKEAEDAIKSGIKVNEQEILETFRNNQEKFIKPLELDLSRIVLEDKNQAEEVIDHINKGASFDKMVQIYSTRNEERLIGGRLGFDYANSYGTLSPQLSVLQVGEVSNVLEYQNGEYHIYKCLGRKEARPFSYKEAIPLIKRQLEKEKFKEQRDQVIHEVKERNNAFINTEKIKELTIQI